MKERQSNIELLRIVCMFMIVAHHFATTVWYQGMAHVQTPASTGEAVVLLMHFFLYRCQLFCAYFRVF